MMQNFKSLSSLFENLCAFGVRRTCRFHTRRLSSVNFPVISSSSKRKYLPELLYRKTPFNEQGSFLKTLSTSTQKDNLNINEDGSEIVIHWNDDAEALSRYHSIWLRYNCKCDSCIQAHSGQKLTDILSIPEKPTLISATLQPDGNHVHLRWKEEPDHVGVVTLDWLKEYCYSQKARNDRMKKCEYKFLTGNIEYFDFEQVMSCEKTFLRYVTFLNEYGVTVIDGIPTENDENKVIEIAKRLGGVLTTLYGAHFDVKNEDKPINVAYTSVELDFHMDLSYYESVPGLQLLHCIRFDDAVVGGESVLLDIFQVVEQLRQQFPDDFDTLCRVPATFQKVHFERENPAAFQYQRSHINVHPVTKHVTAVTWSPQFEGALHVDEDEVVPYYRAYRRLAELLKKSNFKKELQLHPGQCLVFNNRRVLHGRREFQLNGGKRHLRGCYVNIDEFKNVVQVEHLKQGTGELARRVGNQCLF
ncbi:gamma-butyrobetaine dioxygenase-like [Antedon mediterranea]|uniref:gamma-butyrobetaine dioxygenase-like n=1 Tax=Antedon mediterranea TaxID=105859 RepID=UPI003AF54CD6